MTRMARAAERAQVPGFEVERHARDADPAKTLTVVADTPRLAGPWSQL
jgi:hypothetical protein